MIAGLRLEVVQLCSSILEQSCIVLTCFKLKCVNFYLTLLNIIYVEAKLSVFYTQPNDLFSAWLFSIAELLVKPTHQELEFPIGKVGKRHTEFLLITVIVGIPCDEKNIQEN